MRGVRATILAAILAATSGCGGPPVPPSSLKPPPSRCMKAPEPLEELQQGDDLVLKHADLRRSYGQETSKQKCLARYINTIRKDAN